MQKLQQNFHLKTELVAKNLQICMNVCAFHSTVTNVCLENCNGILCKSADQLDYSLECLLGISDNIPTLASHGMQFIERIEFEGLFNK